MQHTKKQSKKIRVKFVSIFHRLFKFRECEIFIRKDAPQACTTVLADFTGECGACCCAHMVT
jgi:hypothetical protein